MAVPCEDVARTTFEDVLVPTDGSDCAEAALGYAADLATRYDATVHVLSVADSRELDNAEHAETVRERRAALASEACEDVADAGVATVEAVRTGLPHEALLEYVRNNDVDLVVMGTHGRTGVERYLLGSVTEKLVRTSPVPVLTVRMPESDAE